MRAFSSKAATLAIKSGYVDEVVSYGGFLALLMFDRKCIMLADPREAQVTSPAEAQVVISKDRPLSQMVEDSRAAGHFFLYALSSSSSSSCVLRAIFSPVGSSLAMVVVTTDGSSLWWEFSSSTSLWSENPLLSRLTTPDSLPVAVCMEGSSLLSVEPSRPLEASLTRRDAVRGGLWSPPATLSRGPLGAGGEEGGGKKNGVRIWASREGQNAWVWSEYGGMWSAGAMPMMLEEDDVLEQHSQTREMLVLKPTAKQMWLVASQYTQQHHHYGQQIHDVTSLPAVLSTLEVDEISNVVGMRFLYHCVCILDHAGTRCSLYDIATGKMVRSFATPEGTLFASVGGGGHVPVVLYGKEMGFQTVTLGPIAKFQEVLPLDRAVRVASDWGLEKVAAWRLLNEGTNPASLAKYTGTPILSVAKANGLDDKDVLNAISSYKQLCAQNPQEAFQRFSELTVSSTTMLDKYLDPKVTGAETASSISEEEQAEIQALDNPSKVLDDLLAQGNVSKDSWKFNLACRLLFQHRPKELTQFVCIPGESDVSRASAALECLPAGANLTVDQAVALAGVLEASGNKIAAARALLSCGVAQNLDFRLAFADALQREDEDALIRLWGNSRLPLLSLLRMLQVYGDFRPDNTAWNGGKLTAGVVGKMLQAQQQKQQQNNH